MLLKEGRGKGSAARLRRAARSRKRSERLGVVSGRWQCVCSVVVVAWWRWRHARPAEMLASGAAILEWQRQCAQAAVASANVTARARQARRVCRL